MRVVGEKLGNTPAVARTSYVSPAVIEQYLEGRRSRISGPAICGLSAPATRGSIRKNRRR